MAQPQFTWWGGAVGQKLLKHVKCRGCRYGYNGRTGAPNTVAIAIYQLTTLFIVFLIWLLFFR